MRAKERHPGGPGRIITRLATASLLALTLAGCTGMRQARLGAGEAPMLIGPAVRDNRTPMDPALSCLAADLIARGRPRLPAVAPNPRLRVSGTTLVDLR